MQRKSLITGSVVALATAMVFSGCQTAAQPTKSPDQVLKDGIKNLTTVTSHQFEFAVNGDVTNPADQKPSKINFNIALAGSADMKNTQDPKINLTLDGSGTADDEGGSASAELRLNKDYVYFTLSKLASTGTDQVPADFTSQYVGKWWQIAIPAGALDKLTAALPTGSGSQEVQTPAQKQMEDLLSNTQFFTNIQYVAAEDVKGTQSYHYTADLDKNAVLNFVTQASVIQGKPMADSDKSDFQTAMNKLDFTTNLWVAADSGILDQATTDMKFVNGTATDPTGTVSLRLTLWNFNNPVTVTAPTGAQDFPVQEVLGALLGGADMGAPSMGTGTPGDITMPTDGSMMSQQSSDGSMLSPPTDSSGAPTDGSMTAPSDASMTQQLGQ